MDMDLSGEEQRLRSLALADQAMARDHALIDVGFIETETGEYAADGCRVRLLAVDETIGVKISLPNKGALDFQVPRAALTISRSGEPMDGCRVTLYPCFDDYEVDIILPDGSGFGFDVPLNAVHLLPAKKGKKRKGE
jgi:hypothetical protein